MTDKTTITNRPFFKKKTASAIPTKEKLKLPEWMKKIKGQKANAFAVSLLTYNLYYTMSSKTGEPIPSPIPDNIAESAIAEINQVVESSGKVATTIKDSMNFREAFQASRVELGPGNFFWWEGKFYNNYTKEEWDTLSNIEKADFAEEAGLLRKEDFAGTDALEEVAEDISEEAITSNVEENMVETTIPQAEPNQQAQSAPINERQETYELQQESTQTEEFIDTDGDGVDDVQLFNFDNDINAEAMIDLASETTYALIDTDNDGMLDSVSVLENGEWTDPVAITQEVAAPKLTTEEMMNLFGNDDKLDSLAIDREGDNRADVIYSDLNADGVYDIAFVDSQGDGKLDMVCKLDADMNMLNPTQLITPYESPEVDGIVETIFGNGGGNGNGLSAADMTQPQKVGVDGSETGGEDEVEGMDSDANIDEFHHE